jgi:hypothetical protein
MRETDLDRQVVRLVYDYRLLSQAQVGELTGKSKSQMQRLLKKLYDHRYLERVLLPIARIGSPPIFYILDKQGRDYLTSQGIEDFSTQPGKQITGHYINHTHDINRVRIRVGQAADAQGFRVEGWLSEGELKADYDRVSIPRLRQPVSLIPDSFFSIHVPGKGSSHLFLELDRGTMRTRRFRDKVEAYTTYYKSGGYKRRYGFSGFRVLTVVSDNVGSGRVESLLATVQNLPQIGRRFWFAHLNDIETHDPLTDPIWTIAGDKVGVPLLE